MSKSKARVKSDENINRLRLLGRGTPRSEPEDEEQKTDIEEFRGEKDKHDLANSGTIQNVIIPALRERIEFLDGEEGQHIGTPNQYVFRGRRMEAKRALTEWLKWSGQADEAPDEGV